MNKLNFLKIWHTAFALHVEYVIEGFEPSNLDPEVVGDELACQLGQWMNSAQQALAEIPEFKQLACQHQNFHAVAAHLILANKTSQTPTGHVSISDLKTASHATEQAIAALERALASAAPNFDPSAQRLQPADQQPTLWDDALLLGIPVLDGQHQEIARLVDSMLSNPSEKLGSETSRQFLRNLSQLLQLHFETEELLMARIGLDALAMTEHQGIHRAILARFASLSTQIDTHPPMTLGELYPLLEESILGHIVEYDMELRPATL